MRPGIIVLKWLVAQLLLFVTGTCRRCDPLVWFFALAHHVLHLVLQFFVCHFDVLLMVRFQYSFFKCLDLLSELFYLQIQLVLFASNA